jgi:hypothetical protein
MVIALSGHAFGAQVAIDVDKSEQRIEVSVDGVLRHRWPISTGRAGYSTPAGSYTPIRLEADHFSKEWDDAPMPHSIFFTRKGHAIHGSHATDKLGTPASAGCVRLAPPNAATLFALVQEHGLDNTRIKIDGTEPPPAGAVARLPQPSERAVRRDVEPYPVQPQPPYTRPYDPWRGYPPRPLPPPPPPTYARPYGALPFPFPPHIAACLLNAMGRGEFTQMAPEVCRRMMPRGMVPPWGYAR